jgi:hypothetical protein
MQRSQLRFDFRRCVKPIVLALAVIALTVFCAALPELFAILPHSTQETLAQRFLVLVLILYWVSLILAVIGGALLTIVIVRARRGCVRCPTANRLLLLCGSTLLCLGIIETASAVWLAWAHRFPALPTRFTVAPSDGLHIAVIGGSSARGHPYQDWLSIGQIVAWKLHAALPGRRVVADVLARAGATL